MLEMMMVELCLSWSVELIFVKEGKYHAGDDDCCNVFELKSWFLSKKVNTMLEMTMVALCLS